MCNKRSDPETIIEPYPPVIEACDYCGVFGYSNFLEVEDGTMIICDDCWGKE